MTAPAAMPYWPAAMDQKSAAAYCGICVDTFKAVCPVRPLKFTSSTRGERYLRQSLDTWLLSLDPNNNNAAPKRRFGERLGGGQSEARRT